MRKLEKEEGTPSFQRVLLLLGGTAAWPAYWNLLFGLFPIQRVSFLRELLNMPPHVENIQYHTWAGYAVLFWLWLHAVLLSIAYAIQYDWKDWWNAMLPYTDTGSFYLTEGIYNFNGWMGLFSLMGLVLTSIMYVRKKWHEFFLICHYVFGFLFVLFSNLHDYNTLPFVLPALMAIITEQLLRKTSSLTSLQTRFHLDACSKMSTSNQYYGSLLSATTCWVKERDNDKEDCNNVLRDNALPIVGITFPIPPSWDKLSIHPGNFIYLKVPSISNWQSHPFTISSFDEDGNVSLHIKALGDWTSDFVNLIQTLSLKELTRTQALTTTSTSNSTAVSNDDGHDDNEENFYDESTNNCLEDRSSPLIPKLLPLDIVVEGPYGDNLKERLASYPRCLMIVGGIGITSVFETLKQRAKFTHLIWCVRTIEEMQFLSDELSLDQLPSRTVRIQIFITGGCTSTASSSRSTMNNTSSSHNQQGHTTSLNIQNNEECRQLQPHHHKKCKVSFQLSPHQSSFIRGEKPYYLLAACTSMASIALSFLFARLICCFQYHYNNVDGTHTRSQKCTFFFGTSTSTCRPCSITEIQQKQSSEHSNYYSDSELLQEKGEEEECCKIFPCYVCFRSMTTILCFFLAPVLAMALFHIMGSLLKLCLRYNIFHHIHCWKKKKRGFSSIDDLLFDEEYQDSLCDYCHVEVKYKRPSLENLLARTFLELHDEENTGASPEIVEEDQNSVSHYYHQSDANDAVVVCCGSVPLVESVTKEVQRLNKKMKKENTTSMGTLDLIVLNPI